MSSLPSRRLVICADDYGISPAVSQGIVQLAVAGRISATGVMSCMPAWPAAAPALMAVADRIEIGLHFTLTDQHPLGVLPVLAPAGRLPGIGALLKLSLAGRIPAAEVAAELDRQLDAFQATFGRSPDFIDGHQHVHVLRGVRGVVLAAFGRRLDPATCWLRDCAEWPDRLLRRPLALKAGLIAGLSWGLRRAAADRGIRTNRGFSGVYDYARQDLAAAFPSLLAGAEDGHLVMVHPGHVDADLAAVDSLIEPRQAEWDFLMGDGLPRVLAARGLILAGKRPFRLTVTGENCQTPAP
jgi:hypothetical protein